MQKPVLYCLHGALGAATQFSELQQAMGIKYQIKTLDFYGHGQLSNNIEALEIQKMANQLEEILKNENQKVAIFGYSMGGYVATFLASKQPELFRWIYTLGTKFVWTEDSAMAESKLLNPENIRAKVPKYATYLQSLHGENWSVLLEKTASLMRSLSEKPAVRLNELASINTPIVVGLGDRDKMISLADALLIFEALPNGELEIWPKTSHPITQVSLTEIAARLHLFDQRCSIK